MKIGWIGLLAATGLFGFVTSEAQAQFLYEQQPLSMTAETVRDANGTFSLNQLPAVQPRCAVELKTDVTPLTECGGIGVWNETTVDEPGLLFHLTEDPTESRNLAAVYPERVKELRDIIMKVDTEKATGLKKLDKKQLGF